MVGIGVKVFVSVERLATKIFISSPDMMADRVGGNRSGSLPSVGLESEVQVVDFRLPLFTWQER